MSFPTTSSRGSPMEGAGKEEPADSHKLCCSYLAEADHGLGGHACSPVYYKQRPQDDTTLTLNEDVYAQPASAHPSPSSPPASSRTQGRQLPRRQQRVGPTPSGLFQAPTHATLAASIHHLNQRTPLTIIASPLPNNLTGSLCAPAPSLGPCFFCGRAATAVRRPPSEAPRRCRHNAILPPRLQLSPSLPQPLRRHPHPLPRATTPASVEGIWDEWSSPSSSLERQRDGLYLAEFPEVTAVPRWGTATWTSVLTAYTTYFSAQTSVRVGEKMLTPHREWRTEIPGKPNSVLFTQAAVQALGGSTKDAPSSPPPEEVACINDEAVSVVEEAQGSPGQGSGSRPGVGTVSSASPLRGTSRESAPAAKTRGSGELGTPASPRQQRKAE
ncbi:hypothetical protein Emag_007765 [Eimeria magna]